MMGMTTRSCSVSAQLKEKRHLSWWVGGVGSNRVPPSKSMPMQVRDFLGGGEGEEDLPPPPTSTSIRLEGMHVSG